MADLIMADVVTTPRRRKARLAAPPIQAAAPPPPRLVSWTAVGIVGGLLVQGGAIFFWAGGMSDRMSAVERDIGPLKGGQMAEQLGRLDERTTREGKDLDDIKISMRRIWDRMQADRVAGARP